jgi:hypothetical protein
VELVVIFTVVPIEPPVTVTAAPEMAVPLELVTLPATLPPVAIAKLRVVDEPDETLADLVRAKYPL